MTLETKAQFARRLKWNRSSITRAAQAGRLVMVGNRVDVEASLARLEATQAGRTDVAARHAAQRGTLTPTLMQGQKIAATDHPASGAPQIDTPATDGESRAQYKALTLKFENQQIQLGMAMARGLHFVRKEVERESTALGAIVRSATERVIDQTAPRLSVMADPARRRDLLAFELRAVRRAIRSEFPRALRRLRNASQRA